MSKCTHPPIQFMRSEECIMCLRAELEAAERDLLIIKDNRDQWRTWCSEAQIKEANTKEDYRALLTAKGERLAAMERALKDIHAMVRSAHSPRWEAVGDIAKKALASPPQPAARQENSDG